MRAGAVHGNHGAGGGNGHRGADGRALPRGKRRARDEGGGGGRRPRGLRKESREQLQRVDAVLPADRNSPYIGPSGGGGGGDSVRVLVPLDLPDDLKLIDDLPIPLSIPNTGDGPLPTAAFALLAVSAALIAAAGYQSGGKSHRGREDRTPPK